MFSGRLDLMVSLNARRDKNPSDDIRRAPYLDTAKGSALRVDICQRARACMKETRRELQPDRLSNWFFSWSYPEV